MIIEYTSNIRLDNYLCLGDLRYGNETMSTNLASCVSLIFYSDKLKKGGLSHITGFKLHTKNYCYPEKVLEKYLEIINKEKISDPEFYVVGGFSSFPDVYYKTLTLLDKNNINYNILSKLNDNNTNIKFEPINSKISIHEFMTITN